MMSSADLKRGEVIHLVTAFFAGDTDRVELWMETPNPGLGMVAPADLLKISPEKLLTWVRAQVEENEL